VGSVFAEPLKVHTWELGTEISHITYKEPDVMREKGMMYGIDGSYTYHQNLTLKAEARFGYGQVDYKNSGTIDNIDDYVWEFRGLGGYDFPILKAATVTPYLGIGYRYLNDDTSGKISSTGAYGYERESNYIYSPIGLEVITPLKNGWSVGAMLEYDYFWKGIQKSHLSNVPGYYDIENNQDEGYGFRGSIKVRNKGEKLDFVIEPFIRYWNIKDSKTTTDPTGTTWIEPKNNSTEFGIKFAVKF
jgi:hypothetical protein